LTRIATSARLLYVDYVGDAVGELLGLPVGDGLTLALEVGCVVGGEVGAIVGAGVGNPGPTGGAAAAGMPPLVLHAESEAPTAAVSTRAKSGPRSRVFLRMTQEGY
jgi:hypothetical protein